MKKFFYLVLSFVIAASFFISCDDDTKDPITPEILNKDTVQPAPTPAVEKQKYQFSVKLSTDIPVLEGITVTVSKDTALTLTSDAEGKVSATLFAGKYDVTVSGKFSDNGKSYTLSGQLTDIEISENFDQTKVFEIALEKIQKNQIVIKELYNGGCKKDDGKTFQNDQYVILYNNSSEKADLKNLGLAMAAPANSYASNKNIEGGKLVYADQGFIPAIYGIWYISEITFEPYEQKVIVFNGAIDNTATVPNSVNLANAAYYACYDTEDFSKTVTPAAEIPETQYFKAVKCGIANMSGWPMSVSSPAFYCFTLSEDPETFGTNEANLYYESGKVVPHAADECIKIPAESIIDGVEVFSADEKYANKNQKRLTEAVDKGYVLLTNYQGHTLYRNVDKTATEQLPENKDKIVYGYAFGTETTDPSGIDAQASIKNGAHIIYLDTDNSSNDFHQRSQATLKD